MVEKRPRIYVVFAIFILVCAVFVLQLIKLQLIDGEEYAERSRNSVITKTAVKASRGDILDRYCSPIVQSETVMTVEIDRSAVKSLNVQIGDLIRIFDKTGDIATYLEAVKEDQRDFTAEMATKLILSNLQ